MTDLIKFDPMEKPNIIKVIGVGGGGSNAVTHMFTEGIQGVDFILCNTDHQALEKSPVAIKIHLGKRTLGAGNVPSVGRDAALETVDEIREILSNNTKMLFVTAGMGGGTGTGAAPVVAAVAKELDILTVGIVTLPFSCEGKRRRQQALEGIEELRKNVDTLLVISNDKLRDEYGDMKLTQAFKKADEVLKTAAKGIAEIITVTGYVNVDFQDVNTVMRDSGKAIMGSGYAEGEDRAMKAVEEAVHSPLLNDSDITGAKNILIYITSGTDEVSLDEVMEITEYVQDATGNCSEVIWGNGEDISLGKGINVTLIATGFNHDENEDINKVESGQRGMIIHDISENINKPKNIRIKEQETTISEKQKEKVHTLEEIKPEQKNDDVNVVKKEKSTKESPIVHTLFSNNEENNLANLKPVTSERETPKSPEKDLDDGVSTKRIYNNPFVSGDDDDIGIKSYIKDKKENDTQIKIQNITAVEKTSIDEKELNQQEILRRQRLSSLNMSLKSLSDIEELENKPAYKRMGIELSVKNSEKEDLSHYSSNKNGGLREDNSFLHDNVD